MKRSLILTVLSFLILAQISLAQVPQTISYQGVLRHPDGTLVPAAGGDTTATITFSLYDVATPTLPVWTETQSVLVSDGLFSVILGKATPFTGIENPPVELGIKVGADAEMTPRVELTSVIYALHADRSDTSEYAQKAEEVSGADNVFSGSGNVGIGTINPSAKLDVAGNANIQGNLVASGDVSTQSTLTALGDANIGGTITIPATDRYYSISPAAFNPPNNSTGFFRSADSIYSAMATGPAVFYAPANLPHGAVIKEMVAAFSDRVDPQNITFDLRRMSLNSTGSDIIARYTSSGSSTSIQTGTEYATTTVATVDNSSYTYVIHTYWTAPTTATDITVRSVKIVYEVTTPLP